jgi:(E)-4-hydroxy-3-methylbut-2-enyl-diphosphate synthase
MSNYIFSPNHFERFPTRVVEIGEVIVGGKSPIVAQSMTTTNTLDTEESVAQCIRMIESGCEIIRFTAPSVKDAENLKVIKEKLTSLGYSTPLVADIHFTPNAALVAAEYVEKVRINPGNFADKKKFESIDYSKEEYELELIRIKEKLIPFIAKCKANNTVVRIGTNHGSLSDRITSYYGDSPKGMVHSAIEFIEIFREFDFHDIVISMKSSNPLVMIHAYRLLCAEMISRNWNYPLHLGVTEAGEGEDGRIKSAIGIGTLLEDGIGDTIRVSLTEEPEAEIPVARELIKRYSNLDLRFLADVDNSVFNPFEYSRRKTKEILNIGSSHVPVVIADFSDREEITKKSLFSCGYSYSEQLDKWTISEMPVDYLFSNSKADFDLPFNLKVIQNADQWIKKEGYLPLIKLGDAIPGSNQIFIEVSPDQIDELDQLINFPNAVLVLKSSEKYAMRNMRSFFKTLGAKKIMNPVIINRKLKTEDSERFKLEASIDCGGLFIDGFGDGIWLENEHSPLFDRNKLSFGILQATRTRISKTEYISCPSCGRTLFDLQETTAKIRKETEHLKGLKIGIMGCIVNGPGEMADADYGYVGTGKGKISLYKEKEVIKRNVAEKDAVNELIDLIKENGDWREP